MATSVNFYQVLQVAPTATFDEIKKAYRKLAMQCHPDIAGNKAENAQRFKQITEAYKVLSNEHTRQAYHYKHFFQSFSANKPPSAVAIAQRTVDLAHLIKSIDPYRLNYDLLIFQIQQCISVEHCALLAKAPIQLQASTQNLLHPLLLLPYKEALVFYQRLLEVNQSDVLLYTSIYRQQKKHQYDYWVSVYQLPAAIILAIACCVVWKVFL